MTDLTPHQRSILIAMLQGRDIEWNRGTLSEPEWVVAASPHNAFNHSGINWERLRIAHNQDEAMRLAGIIQPSGLGDLIGSGFTIEKGDDDTHYIDICANGFIIGGKIDE